VRVTAPESAKRLYAELCRAVWRAGGHVLGDYRPDDDRQVNLTRDFYEIGGENQHRFFDREVLAVMRDGGPRTIYASGQFELDS
jgi:hypothetical protein